MSFYLVKTYAMIISLFTEQIIPFRELKINQSHNIEQKRLKTRFERYGY